MSVGIRKPLSVGVVALCVLVGGLAFGSAPALAAAPEISEEQVTGVETSAATLQAEINPDGVSTSYHFEYDTSPYTSSASHGTSVTETKEPEVNIGSGASPVSVSVRLTGLQPATTYYRVVAVSGSETADGPDKTVTTPPGASTAPETCPNAQRRAEQPFGLTLPDCRAYEMVSPLETNGQDATDPDLARSARAAVSGEAVTYASNGSFAEPEGETGMNQFLSRREPATDRWSTQSITPLHEPVGAETIGSYEGLVFTPELTEGIAETSARLTADAPVIETRVGYRESELYVAGFEGEGYRYVAERPAGLPEWASADLSHVVLGGSEWVNGTVVPVLVTNYGEGMNASVEGWHAVSSDGSRVYFAAEGALYVRVNAEQVQSPLEAGHCAVPTDACTVEVSAAPAQYWGASADGEKVFFTKGEDLYEYNLPVGQLTGKATALTAGGEVQGVVQISEDGSYVYFVAGGRLAAGAKAGEPNLYVSHEDDEPKFIATLAASDNADWSYGPEADTAVVSPDGSRLAFLSKESLTGYDNEQAQPGECEGKIGYNNKGETGKCREVYLYEAGTGKLVCASCDPTDARPSGPANLGSQEQSSSSYRPRNFTEDGTLFFDSYDALVPHASDGRQNVYEYENGRVYAISNVAGGFESFFLDASANGENVFFGTADQLLPEDVSNNVVVYDARIGGGSPVTVSPAPCDNGDSCKSPPTPQPTVFGAPASATFSGVGNATTAVTATVMVKKKTAAQLKAEKLVKALGRCRVDKKKGVRKSCEASARRRYENAKMRNSTKSVKAGKASDNRRASR